jgi:hypothetical protein
MDSRHRIGAEGIDPAELQRIAAQFPDTELSEARKFIPRREEESQSVNTTAAENLPTRKRVSAENAAMVVGIAEGFDNEELKPPGFASEIAEITPDIAMQYAVRLIEYRIGAELKRAKGVKNEKDLRTITDNVEALSTQKGKIAGGNVEAAIKFLKGEDAVAIHKLGIIQSSEKSFDPRKRMPMVVSGDSNVLRDLHYYLKRRMDSEGSIKALGGKIADRRDN